ncbi:MAG: RraA family protein [Lentisphaerae bacterium]|nr:MAG: RraA family protein [Lentisphaerota bacterium]
MERISRFRRAGYGGAVADALASLEVYDTILSTKFRPLRPDMILAGRALTVKVHTDPQVNGIPSTILPHAKEEMAEKLARYEQEGGHPQKRLMTTITQHSPGCILCYDCGGDLQAGHFGEMSSQLARAHGAYGLLIAGNCRDTRYVMQMENWPVFCLGTAPNAHGGWSIIEIQTPIYLPGHLTHYVRVNPGDFIYGDMDGVIVIPRHLVDETLLRVEAIFERENAERTALAAGMDIDEVYRTYGIL